VIGTNREDEMGIQEKTKFKSRLQQEHDLWCNETTLWEPFQSNTKSRLVLNLLSNFILVSFIVPLFYLCFFIFYLLFTCWADTCLC
jgi:hypothetical protein